MPLLVVWPTRMIRDGEESFAEVNVEGKASLRDNARRGV